MQVIQTQAFKRTVAEVLRHYPNSKSFIADYLENQLPFKYKEGTLISSKDGQDIYKIRLPLQDYKIGKSGGLRLLALALLVHDKLVPIVLYSKKQHPGAAVNTTWVKEKLKETIAELKDNNCA